MMLDWVTSGAFVAILLLAAGLDVRSGRIPNPLTLGGLMLGLLLRALGGVDALAHGWRCRSSPSARWVGAT
jgi:Flp pilus assembly protein protease CpaA